MPNTIGSPISSRVAGFNSSTRVKGKLQAALYWNRKRRLKRIADSNIPEVSGGYGAGYGPGYG